MADGVSSGFASGTSGSSQMTLENASLKIISGENEKRLKNSPQYCSETSETNEQRLLIIPFVGYGYFKLYQSTEEAKRIIKNKAMSYTIELWNNLDCTNQIPWETIRIDKRIHLFFAKNKLFKIYLDNNCKGSLPNGITIGMPMTKALEIDKELIYNDWKEDYQSPHGYWIEDNLDDNTVLSISIFIKEVLNAETFERYEW